jgi:hypothetical protein
MLPRLAKYNSPWLVQSLKGQLGTVQSRLENPSPPCLVEYNSPVRIAKLKGTSAHSTITSNLPGGMHSPFGVTNVKGTVTHSTVTFTNRSTLLGGDAAQILIINNMIISKFKF